MKIEDPNTNLIEKKEKEKDKYETRSFNESVLIRLTARGQKILKEELGSEFEVNDDGYSEMTLNDLMKYLGSQVSINKRVDAQGENQLPFHMYFKIKKTKNSDLI